MRRGVLFLSLGVGGAAPTAQPEIIDNPAPTHDAPAYRLSVQPLIRVGGLSGDERYEIVRFADAVLLPSGNLAVATGPEPTATVVRIFSPPGRFVHSSGREGSGPGEYRAIRTLTPLAGDSLLVHDSNLRRLTLVSPAGSVVSTTANVGGGDVASATGRTSSSEVKGPTSPRRSGRAIGSREIRSCSASVVTPGAQYRSDGFDDRRRGPRENPDPRPRSRLPFARRRARRNGVDRLT